MATKKKANEKKETTKKKETTSKESTRNDSVKKEAKKETKKETKPEKVMEELVEPSPEAVEELEKLGVIDEPVDTPDPDGAIEGWQRHADEIARAKPEKLDVFVIDEDMGKSECEKKAVKMITVDDIPPKPKTKAAKSHDPANDVIITTFDFKPRKWGGTKKS